MKNLIKDLVQKDKTFSSNGSYKNPKHNHIMTKTRSGKDIHTHKLPHEYKDWSVEDHEDASKHHLDEGYQNRWIKQSRLDDLKDKDKIDELEEIAGHHYNLNHAHTAYAAYLKTLNRGPSSKWIKASA